MTIRAILLRYAAFALPLLFVAGARGQSLYVDLDIFAGDPSNGNGAPSSSFGGAAGVPGHWNRVLCTTGGSWALRDTSGQSTSVAFSIPVGNGSGGGSNFPINTGDYALLLNDYAVIPTQMMFRFSGIRPGAYHIFTYAVNATGATWPVDVTVEDAGQPNPQRVTGPMPGNTLALGITHSEHFVPNLMGDLVIRLDSPWPRGHVNGFQIVAVPEPASLTVLSCLFALAVRRRRRM